MNDNADYEYTQLRSVEDEAGFFAQMGWFFASPNVRRECGGYPLNDGQLYRWFVVRQRGRVLGFISLEQRSDIIRIRDGFVRAEARGRGLFRALRAQALYYIDQQRIVCSARVTSRSAELLAPYGFTVQSTRGNWVTMERRSHAASRESDGACERVI